MRKFAALVMSLVLGAGVASGASYPSVGTGTTPNKWTCNFNGVLSAAKKTGYPILLVVVSHGSAFSCGHCQMLNDRTLVSSEFKQLVNDVPFYMCLVNLQPDGPGGYYGSTFAYNLYTKYKNNDVLPVCAILDYTGAKKYWRTKSSTDYSNVTSYLREKLELLSKPSVTAGFSETEASFTVGSEYKGKAVLSNADGLTGSAKLVLSGDNVAQYKISPATVNWKGSGEVEFTVTGPTDADGRLVLDTLNVSMTGISVPAAKLSYGDTNLVLTVKDERIAKTLEEFKDENEDFDSLNAEAGDWYVPSDGSAQLVADSSEGELTWTAPEGGELIIAPAKGSSATVTIGEEPTEVKAGEITKFGVASGDEVSIQVKTVEEESEEEEQSPENALKLTSAETEPVAKLQELAFASLQLTLSNLASGEKIQWRAICADASLVDLSWEAEDATRYVLEGGALVEPLELKETTVNAVEAGLLSTNAAAGKVTWKLSAYKTSDVGEAVTEREGSFEVVDVPVFSDDVANSASFYKKADSSLFVTATGASALTYSAKNLPAGLKINSSTGEITGVPTAAVTRSVTITATDENGNSSSTVVSIKTATLPTSLKGKYFGVVMSGEDVVGTASWSLSSSGKASAKFLLSNGTKGSSKATLSVVNGSAFALGNGSNFEVVQDGTLWSGTWGSYTVHAKQVTKKSAYAGNYTQALLSDNNAGYLTAKVTASNGAKVKGKIKTLTAISISSSALLLTADEVATVLPSIDAPVASALIPVTKTVAGRNIAGYILIANYGTSSGKMKAASEVFDVEGSYYDAKSINLTQLKSSGGCWQILNEDATVSLNTPSKVKMSLPKSNAYSAKLSFTKSSGVFKGSFKLNGSTYKYEGAILQDALEGFATAVSGRNYRIVHIGKPIVADVCNDCEVENIEEAQ